MSKAVVIIDMPQCCEKCFFCACKYALPLSTGRKGIYCQLDSEKEIFDIAFDKKNFLSQKCPLRPLPKKKNVMAIDVASSINEIYTSGKEVGWNKCLDVITGGTENE